MEGSRARRVRAELAALAVWLPNGSSSVSSLSDQQLPVLLAMMPTVAGDAIESMLAAQQDQTATTASTTTATAIATAALSEQRAALRLVQELGLHAAVVTLDSHSSIASAVKSGKPWQQWSARGAGVPVPAGGGIP